MSLKTTLKKISPENWLAMAFGFIGGAVIVYASGILALVGIILLMWGNDISLSIARNREADSVNLIMSNLRKKQ